MAAATRLKPRISPERWQQPDLLRLDFDQYLRYRCTTEIVTHLLPEPVSLLEVGSNVIDLFPAFFGEQCTKATRCDVHEPDHPDPSYVRIDTNAPLPFADGEYDVVAALEVLEHVPAAERRRFLGECARVARRLLVVSCPRGEPDVVEAEAILNRYCRHASGVDHPFLAEHVLFGLPTPAEVAALLDGLHAPWVLVPNSHLPTWIAMNLVSNDFARDAVGLGVLGDLNALFNSRFYDAARATPAYRSIYVLAKDPALFLDLPPGWHTTFFHARESSLGLAESSLRSACELLAAVQRESATFPAVLAAERLRGAVIAAQIVTDRTRLDALEAEAFAARAEADRARADRRAAEAALNHVTSSWSWRATALPRTAGSWLGRLVRRRT